MYILGAIDSNSIWKVYDLFNHIRHNFGDGYIEKKVYWKSKYHYWYHNVTRWNHSMNENGGCVSCKKKMDEMDQGRTTYRWMLLIGHFISPCHCDCGLNNDVTKSELLVLLLLLLLPTYVQYLKVRARVVSEKGRVQIWNNFLFSKSKPPSLISFPNPVSSRMCMYNVFFAPYFNQVWA
jgi:hypothetical protein